MRFITFSFTSKLRSVLCDSNWICYSGPLWKWRCCRNYYYSLCTLLHFNFKIFSATISKRHMNYAFLLFFFQWQFFFQTWFRLHSFTPNSLTSPSTVFWTHDMLPTVEAVVSNREWQRQGIFEFFTDHNFVINPWRYMFLIENSYSNMLNRWEKLIAS